MKKPSAETAAILAAIESSRTAAISISGAVAQELAAHTELDDARHEENKQTLASIAEDVKSLLEYRTFTKGIWRAVVGIAITVSTVVGLVIAWVKG